MIQPGGPTGTVEPFVSPMSRSGWGASLLPHSAICSSAAWPATNRALYVPFTIAAPCIAYRLFWCNGATAGTNNLQAGIYNDNDAGTDGPGTAVILGTSTLSAGASACQFDNIADTALYPGRYWLALWCNGTTATVLRWLPSNTLARGMNAMLESSLTGGLPSTATPAANTTPIIPLVGFTTIASP